MSLKMRPATPADAEALWTILKPAFRAGDTYTVAADIPRAKALAFWTAPEKSVYVAELPSGVVGTFYVKANQGGGGAHVCNAGFVVHPQARGQGVAGAMLAHSQTVAREMGFRAMQFNFVVTTNAGAIAIWARDGFETVGRLPGAFRHPVHGYVDALVMYKQLVET
ncbi:GNAT family N-acetyltransferase [Meridianimarinicoccus sp. MJW13]|uniref:GNAT family N-acetyltransferase n=1 Tax=Meridianimarinicoccus sp. MJW13 TaxID=2720031 RepID=UPI00186895D7|nr:N-acetyltransferase [Fluviibacterium sp. MJW13]